VSPTFRSSLTGTGSVSWDAPPVMPMSARGEGSHRYSGAPPSAWLASGLTQDSVPVSLGKHFPHGMRGKAQVHASSMGPGLVAEDTDGHDGGTLSARGRKHFANVMVPQSVIEQRSVEVGRRHFASQLKPTPNPLELGVEARATKRLYTGAGAAILEAYDDPSAAAIRERSGTVSPRRERDRSPLWIPSARDPPAGMRSRKSSLSPGPARPFAGPFESHHLGSQGVASALGFASDEDVAPRRRASNSPFQRGLGVLHALGTGAKRREASADAVLPSPRPSCRRHFASSNEQDKNHRSTTIAQGLSSETTEEVLRKALGNHSKGRPSSRVRAAAASPGPRPWELEAEESRPMRRLSPGLCAGGQMGEKLVAPWAIDYERSLPTSPATSRPKRRGASPFAAERPPFAVEYGGQPTVREQASSPHMEQPAAGQRPRPSKWESDRASSPPLQFGGDGRSGTPRPGKALPVAWSTVEAAAARLEDSAAGRPIEDQAPRLRALSNERSDIGRSRIVMSSATNGASTPPVRLCRGGSAGRRQPAFAPPPNVYTSRGGSRSTFTSRGTSINSNLGLGIRAPSPGSRGDALGPPMDEGSLRHLYEKTLRGVRDEIDKLQHRHQVYETQLKRFQSGSGGMVEAPKAEPLQETTGNASCVGGRITPPAVAKLAIAGDGPARHGESVDGHVGPVAG